VSVFGYSKPPIECLCKSAEHKLAFGSVNANKHCFEMGLKDFQKIKARFGNLLPRIQISILKPEEFQKAFEPSGSEIKTIIDFT
jgi:hypothetical protein